MPIDNSQQLNIHKHYHYHYHINAKDTKSMMNNNTQVNTHTHNGYNNIWTPQRANKQFQLSSLIKQQQQKYTHQYSSNKLPTQSNQKTSISREGYQKQSINRLMNWKQRVNPQVTELYQQIQNNHQYKNNNNFSHIKSSPYRSNNLTKTNKATNPKQNLLQQIERYQQYLRQSSQKLNMHQPQYDMKRLLYFGTKRENNNQNNQQKYQYKKSQNNYNNNNIVSLNQLLQINQQIQHQHKRNQQQQLQHFEYKQYNNKNQTAITRAGSKLFSSQKQIESKQFIQRDSTTSINVLEQHQYQLANNVRRQPQEQDQQQVQLTISQIHNNCTKKQQQQCSYHYELIRQQCEYLRDNFIKHYQQQQQDHQHQKQKAITL